jgi:protein TonB
MLTIAQDSALPNPRRGWATLISFALQATALTVVLLVPLLQPGMLPRLDLTQHLVPLFLPPAVTPSAPRQSIGRPSVDPHMSIITVPRSIPLTTNLGPDRAAAQNADTPCVECVPGIGPGIGIPDGLKITTLVVPLLPSKSVEKPKRVSHMMDGLLIHRVQPDYPLPAKLTHVQGTVEIAALISKEGTIENLQVVSGHPMLIRAALDAVKQWRYRPYILNGEPIEVNTRITVNFSLGGN